MRKNEIRAYKLIREAGKGLYGRNRKRIKVAKIGKYRAYEIFSVDTLRGKMYYLNVAQAIMEGDRWVDSTMVATRWSPSLFEMIDAARIYAHKFKTIPV
jgi:hypothetical protein